MTKNKKKNGVPARRPTVHVVARAACEFGEGQTRTLYATRFSIVDMFILSVRPPPVGTTFKVTLSPQGLPPLPRLEAIVVATRLDPADIRKSGFGALISNIDDESIKALHSALSLLGLRQEVTPDRPSIERRKDPRIWSDLMASVEIPGAAWNVDVVNLSMSGALLDFGDAGLPVEITPGTAIHLDIIGKDIPELISIRAEVVRVVGVMNPKVAGVKFLEVNEILASRVEGLILHLLSDEDGDGEGDDGLTSPSIPVR